HEHACLPGTRASLLKTINEWTMASHSLYLLIGPAGAGKSTIAHTVASHAQEKGILGGCFFLHRDFNDRRDAHLVVTSLAFQLAHFDFEIAKNIRNILTRDPDLTSSSSLQNKFLHLIIKPAKHASVEKKNILLVIDDLDALDNGKFTNSDSRQAFLACIASLESKLPSTLKIFMTSRPETDILMELSSFWRCSVPLDTKEAQDDLKRYVMSCMVKITRKYRYLDSNWPGSETILELVKKAGGLFIWIHTVYLFVMQRDASQRLKTVLSSQPLGEAESELDKLYIKALLDHPDMSDSVFSERFQQVVGGIVVLFKPLSSFSLDSLLKLAYYSDDIISSLQAFLHNTDTGVVRFIHPSFPEYLVDKKRCKNDKLRIDKLLKHRELAKACFNRMHEMLRRNICDLDSSKLNTEVANLDERIKKNISEELQYACQYWAYHLDSMSELDKETYELVKQFFQDDLLQWLEVLSLLQKMKFTLISLNLALDKLEVNKYTQPLTLAYDAKKIVHNFYHLIDQSAMHIYDSALLFTPQQTILYKTYFSKWKKYIRILNGPSLQWSTSLITMCEGHTNWIRCMAISPNGLIIVSGSDDKTLRLWDAKSGAVIGQALTGHSDGVNCVAFSPDSSIIVSGSNDGTLCLWHAKLGTIIGEPLKGHNGHVICLAFSPDGLKIVSGSLDKTLYLWNVKSGAAIGVPLKGHSGQIEDVAFSPDGSMIVSCSDDKTLCLWNVQLGVAIGKPLKGHTGSVSHVVFSSNSSLIVSCSVDKTLRLWDAKLCAAIGEPLKGHTGLITDIAFSPDGSIIVSGSYDKTLRLWNATSGTAIGEPLKGHSTHVLCVAFSPDGSMILVSGSSDKTLYLWNAKSGAAIGGPLKGHTEAVVCVAFSPDGSMIVSGSYDNTLCLWNSKLDITIEEPLNSHSDEVVCVAFSPDGSTIASGSYDNTIYLWDAKSGKAIGGPFNCHSGPIRCIAFSPDGLIIVSGSDDETLYLWDTKLGVVIWGPLNGHSDGVRCVAFSPDGSRIVSGSYDSTLRLWNTKSGEPIGESLKGHIGPVTCVTFSPDGSKIVSGSTDKTLRLWDAKSGASILEPLQGHSRQVTCVAVSPDSSMI
ncbi:WD40 repeat-like protein, partial [Rickenella mellea]